MQGTRAGLEPIRAELQSEVLNGLLGQSVAFLRVSKKLMTFQKVKESRHKRTEK